MLILKINFNYFNQIKLLAKTRFSTQIKSLKKFWHSQSGDWHWLERHTTQNIVINGAAGAFANSRRRIADALPGVAIAVALVPPLSVS